MTLSNHEVFWGELLPSVNPFQASFVCTDLGGDPCADYGIRFEGARACQAGVVLGRPLAQGESAAVELWYAPGVAIEGGARCHFWCSSAGGGDLPLRPDNVTRRGLLDSLVRGLGKLEENVVKSNIGLFLSGQVSNWSRRTNITIV